MKLPFDLGVKLIFRLLAPGFFLTLGFYPLLAALKAFADWPIDLEYLFILSVIVLGWLIVLSDQQLYMLLEGRRYWPLRLRELFVSREQKRLEKTIERYNKFYVLSEASNTPAKRKNAYQAYIEASLELRKFPLDEKGEPEAKFPTRLGNLLDAFESYPYNRYGIEAIFHWYRIWLTLDKDLREELDNRQALADSAVYSSVALFINGALWFVYGALQAFEFTLAGTLPGIIFSLILATVFFVSGWLLYRASNFAQYQYGETFKSVFDVFHDRIDVSRALTSVERITRDATVLNKSGDEQLLLAWRYLHNYKVRCPKPECNKRLLPMSPEALKKHLDTYHDKKTDDASLKDPLGDEHSEYREKIRSLYDLERRIDRIKKLSFALSSIALGLGFFLSYWLFAVALLISLICWVREIMVKREYEKGVAALIEDEKDKKLPLTHKQTNYGGWRAYAVSPHAPLALLAILLLVLWSFGIFQDL